MEKYYEAVKEFFSKESWEKEIKKRYKEYDGLIDEKAIAFLIVDELGKNPVAKPKISEIKEGDIPIISGWIDEIGDGFLILSDNSGKTKFFLPENLAQNIKKGEMIRILNCKAKGKELYATEWTEIETTGRKFITLREIEKFVGAKVNIRGKILSKGLVKSFRKKNGGYGSVSNWILFDGTGDALLVLWDVASYCEKYNEGEEIEVIGGQVKKKNRIEIHCDPNTKIHQDMRNYERSE